jgi:phage tail tape-measure protein
MPKGLQNFIAANPGTMLKDGSQFLKYTKSVVCEMPYLGTVLNAVGQTYEAASGEKSWGRASADFAADTVGSAVDSALGGAAVGAVMGSEVPVVGTIIGAGVGAFLGSAAADKMVDIISNPAEFDEKAVQNFQTMNLGTNNALNYPG